MHPDKCQKVYSEKIQRAKHTKELGVSYECHSNLVSWLSFARPAQGNQTAVEWTIGVEFDESSLLDRGAVRKMTGRKGERSFTGGIRVSIHISFSSDPFILGDLDTEGTSGTGRGSTTPSWRSRGTGNEGARGVELKKEHEERWHDILDAD